jgi:hypothetical protein
MYSHGNYLLATPRSIVTLAKLDVVAIYAAEVYQLIVDVSVALSILCITNFQNLLPLPVVLRVTANEYSVWWEWVELFFCAIRPPL